MQNSILNPKYEIEIASAFQMYVINIMYGEIVKASDIEEEYRNKECDDI